MKQNRNPDIQLTTNENMVKILCQTTVKDGHSANDSGINGQLSGKK